MLPFFLLLLLQLVTLSLTLVTAVRHPSRRAAVLVGIALGTCLGAGYQVHLQRIMPVTLGGILGLDACYWRSSTPSPCIPHHAGAPGRPRGVDQPYRCKHGRHAATDAQRIVHGLRVPFRYLPLAT